MFNNYKYQQREHINGNASKPRISNMHNVQETQKNVSEQTDNRVIVTSTLPILVDFAFEFWYKPLRLYRE